jgi:hypothetical protein
MPPPAQQQQQPQPQPQQSLGLLSTGPNQARLAPTFTPLLQPMHAAAAAGTTFIQQPAPGALTYQIQQPTMVLTQPGMAQQAMVLQPMPGQAGGYALVSAATASTVPQTSTYPSNRPGRVMMPMQRSTARPTSTAAPQQMASQAMLLQPSGPQQAGLAYGPGMLQPVQLQMPMQQLQYGSPTLQQVAEEYPGLQAQEGWGLEAYEEYAPAESYQQYVMAPAPMVQQQWQVQQPVQQLQQLQATSSAQLPQLMPPSQLLPVMPSMSMAPSGVIHYRSMDGSPSSIGSAGGAGLPQQPSLPQLGSTGAEDPALLSRLQALLTQMDQAVVAERGSLG